MLNEKLDKDFLTGVNIFLWETHRCLKGAYFHMSDTFNNVLFKYIDLIRCKLRNKYQHAIYVYVVYIFVHTLIYQVFMHYL